MSLISKIIFIITTTLILNSTSQAAQWGGFIGINSTEFSGDGDWDRDFGIEFGASYVMPLWKTLSFRTGGGFVQKNSEQGAISFKFTYIEIPAVLMVPLSAQWNLLGGINFDFLLSTSPASINGEEAFMFTLPIGVHYNISGPHSLQGILEFGLTDMASGTGGTYQLGNSLDFRYHYTF